MCVFFFKRNNNSFHRLYKLTTVSPTKLTHSAQQQQPQRYAPQPVDDYAYEQAPARRQDYDEPPLYDYETDDDYDDAASEPQEGFLEADTYDPTPYADTLYCLNCQEKCALQLAPQCPSGRGWYHFRSSCYYFEPSIQLTWREARGFCAGLTDETGSQRGHSIVINDVRENDFLSSRGAYLEKSGFRECAVSRGR